MKYAVITKSSVYIPGDETSRTRPGHGYPESWEETIQMQEFENEEKLVKFLEFRGDSLKNARIIRFEDVAINKRITINVC